MTNALDAIPAEARAVFVDGLTRRGPALLAELRDTQEPTTEQRDAVERLLASAVIKAWGQIGLQVGMAWRLSAL